MNEKYAVKYIKEGFGLFINDLDSLEIAISEALDLQEENCIFIDIFHYITDYEDCEYLFSLDEYLYHINESRFDW